MIKKEINPFLKGLFPIVNCIADLFGKDCEVVLHDISDPEHSIIKIRNGHVTGRKEGAPLTDIALEMIRDAKKGLEILGNYNPHSKNGRLLKSNAVNIRDTKGKHVGIMCINFDVSQFQQSQHSIEQMSEMIKDFAYTKEEPKIKAKEERFEHDIWTILKGIIDKVIKEKGKTPDLFTKEEKQEIINNLDEKGIFFVKGAIHLIANALGISTPTIYRYLEETRLQARESKT